MRACLTASVLALLSSTLTACPAPDYNEYVEGTTAYTSHGQEPLEPQEAVPLAAVGETVIFLEDFRRRLDSLGEIPNAAATLRETSVETVVRRYPVCR